MKLSVDGEYVPHDVEHFYIWKYVPPSGPSRVLHNVDCHYFELESTS